VLKKTPQASTLEHAQRSDVVFTAYLPPALHDALVSAAAREMTSQSAYVRKALALRLHADGLLPEIG
jgi:predicted HicB family RNase H-like nuclease